MSTRRSFMGTTALALAAIREGNNVHFFGVFPGIWVAQSVGDLASFSHRQVKRVFQQIAAPPGHHLAQVGAPIVEQG